MKRWLLAFAVAFPLGFGALYGAGCLSHANFCGGKSPSTGITAGDQLFIINCAKCHGEKGEGGRAGELAVPSLVSGDAAGLSYDQLISKIAKGRPFKGMPAFSLGPGHLSPDQIQAIARYVLSLRVLSLRGSP